MKFNKIQKMLVCVLSMAMIATSLPANTTPVQAAESGSLKSVESAKADGNVVTITFNDGIQAKLTVLEDNIFRYNVDPSGEFNDYAEVWTGYPDTAKIQQYPDSSDNYTKPAVKVKDSNKKIVITNNAGKTQIVFDKTTAKMSVLAGNKVVMQEKAPLELGTAKFVGEYDVQGTPTIQRLVENPGENFFGGGTQNGRFIHTGKVINIENESSWIDGGVSSPSPFYYSTAGYGVLRNTYMDGSYDFGSTEDGIVKTSHQEDELDAYYFISDADNNAEVVQDLLQGYFHVTGNPVLLPAYGFYLGHLNAYNRDMWSEDENIGVKWTVKGNEPYTSEGKTVYEMGGTGTTLKPGMKVESLNGHGPKKEFSENIPEGVEFPREFSAQAIIDRYVGYDMPFGFFLPNDGYGCGYGQNGYQVQDDKSEDRLKAVAANVENLKEFADYAQSKGIATGLWTQSNLTPDTAAKNEQWQLLRDFYAEVKAGVTTLKTDVAWVGYGYSFQLSGVKQAYDIVTTTEYEDGRANTRPNIISLDGWAGSQRYNSVWTGDQLGGKWAYIGFHVPTFIGQSLAGNPNIGCDMDAIWDGAPIIATRDYQWKSFAPQMLDMDGWGEYVKGPFTHGDPYTGVARMYLKMKAMLMPYIYTNAYAAANIETGNGDKGLPMIRAMFLEFPEEEEAYGRFAEHQYMWGENLLVAPVFEEVQIDEVGNDVRNDIYLPGGEKQIWNDYFTGEQYQGGQVLQNFDAPLWKLPLFVKNGAIIPMYAENNSAYETDKTQRIVEFWPEGTTEFNVIEDDGTFVENKLEDGDEQYGTIDNVSYGDHVETLYTSEVKGKKATLTANESTGTYPGYDQNKDTTFIVHVSKAPNSLKALEGKKALKEVIYTDKAEFENAKPEKGTFASFYDAAPAIETFASEKEVNIAKMVENVKVSGKLYVKFANTDSQANKQTLVIDGFANDGDLNSVKNNNKLAAPVLRNNEEAATHKSITLEWDAVKGADAYQIEVDGSGMIHTIAGGATCFVNEGLPYKSEHTYRIRSVGKDGVSKWSAAFKASTVENPFLNTPEAAEVIWNGGLYSGRFPEAAFDRIIQDDANGFRSGGSDAGPATPNHEEKPLTVDYGKAYLFDKIDFHPFDPYNEITRRGDMTKLRVESSLDGVHWIRHGNTVDEEDGGKVFERNIYKEDGSLDREEIARVVTIDLSDPNTGADYIGARYFRFTKLNTEPDAIFSTNEIQTYALEGEATIGSVWKPFKVGNISSVGMKEASLSSFQLIYQKESSAHGCYKNATWVGEVQAQYGDINFNGYSDVYDYAFTAFQADGGTTKTGSVAGNVTLVPSATTIKAGETFTVAVTAENVENLNAYGSIMHYDPSLVEYVGVSYDNTAKMYTQGMTGNIINDDGTAYVNHNAVNMGDQELINGSMVLSTVTMKAKQDITLTDDVLDLSTVTIMGPDYSFINCTK